MLDKSSIRGILALEKSGAFLFGEKNVTWRQRFGWLIFLTPPLLSFVILMIVFCSFFGIIGVAVGLAAAGISLAGLAMVIA